MALIEVKEITHSFGEKLLYSDASFELFKGEHMGIVGQNGTGKTTLLNSIIGVTVPDKGEIKIQKNVKIGYLDQHAKIDSQINVFDYLKTAFGELFEIDAKLAKLYEQMAEDTSAKIMNMASTYQSTLESNGFYEVESTILKVAQGLGITVIGMDKILQKVSGGQRARIILAKLLLEKPEVLLLDEPTNFLDKEHVEWLVEFLQEFEGAFIVISHDFDFLDKVTNCICDIEFNKIEKYHGNFSKFTRLKELKRENYNNELVAQQRQIKKLEEYISKNKARASTANMAKGRQKQLDKIDRMSELGTTVKPHFQFKSLPISVEKTLVVKDLEIGYYYPLLPKLNFEIGPGQKVVITGFNGIGKSTLLKTLIGELPLITGKFKFNDNVKIAYFSQDLIWENKNANAVQIVLNEFHDITEKQARKHLAQCGIMSKNALQAVSTLSGGEQVKIKLCLLMLTKANLLILDEPTNHIDVDTKEVLKKQLINWGGSIILVSHEAAFYRDWMDKIIQIGKN